ncbi:MAG: FadR family transcriptional regulator [Candidatus Hydrogenedentes bacterium]|nr:FadR family transcriptional regulator [Candidatus Hydrogenedentota bacterium]
MSIREPNTDTLANLLADRMHAEIVASGLQENEFFTTGDQVAKDNGVSRSIARESLGKLTALGVLKSRQRKGLLVGRPDPVKLMSRWVPCYGRGTQGNELSLLAELRYVLELGSVDLAVPHASEDQIKRLSTLADQFEYIASEFGHNPEADQIDLVFHTLILEMTGNELIAGMHRVLADYFLASSREAPKPSEDSVSAIRAHHMIADAFARRDAEMVRSVLRSHLRRTLDE